MTRNGPAAREVGTTQHRPVCTYNGVPQSDTTCYRMIYESNRIQERFDLAFMAIIVVAAVWWVHRVVASAKRLGGNT